MCFSTNMSCIRGLMSNLEMAAQKLDFIYLMLICHFRVNPSGVVASVIYTDEYCVVAVC